MANAVSEEEKQAGKTLQSYRNSDRMSKKCQLMFLWKPIDLANCTTINMRDISEFTIFKRREKMCL